MGVQTGSLFLFRKKGTYVLGGDGNRLTEGRWEDGDE